MQIRAYSLHPDLVGNELAREAPLEFSAIGFVDAAGTPEVGDH
jgi:hypothetical protein